MVFETELQIRFSYDEKSRITFHGLSMKTYTVSNL